MTIVISVEDVSKYYRLGLIGGRTLHSDLERWWARVRGKPDPLLKIDQADRSNQDGEYIWALKEVSFTVSQGEALGIIGRNGAGKSTLLKILSRVTAPTSGEVKIKASIASLLEIGTGFHPELTGRENIYLNGTILGMKKPEIARKFDEIVAFAEIEKFINTPVKRYSSGMYVRLAFAVAAYLESEILIVDEVLAVGDVQFQNKCLGKMENVAEEGRTVLFVSHNLNAIRRLCKRTILLADGRLTEDNTTSVTIDRYLSENILRNITIQDLIRQLPSDPDFKLWKIAFKQNGSDLSSEMRFVASEAIDIEFIYEVYDIQKKMFICLELWDNSGIRLAENFHNGFDPREVVQQGKYYSNASIPPNLLVPLKYELHVEFGIFGDRSFTKGPIRLSIEIYSDGISNMVYGIRPLSGKIALPIRWDTKRI
jgi:lipopolysaccharide transport system ATP-binding protein